MGRLDLTTTIHAPPADVYDFLLDVEGFPAYSEYVRGVTRRGDGGAGTEYGVALAWWKLTYTVRFRVVDLDPPERVVWRVVEDVESELVWHLEPTTVDDPAVDEATAVTLTARYDPETADRGALTLPPFVPTSRVVAMARPVVRREAERILERVVADLEGEPREATLTIEVHPDVG